MRPNQSREWIPRLWKKLQRPGCRLQEPGFRLDVVLATPGHILRPAHPALIMTIIRNMDNVLPSQDPPVEFLRLCSAHPSQEPTVAHMLSGVIAARQEDGVICRHMLRRNLVVPRSQASVSRGPWPVE